jgi:hypothetical protein
MVFDLPGPPWCPATVRLSGGTYAALQELDVEGAHGPHSLGKAVLSAPEIVLDRDRTVVLDARAARQVTAVTPEESTTTAAPD